MSKELDQKLYEKMRLRRKRRGEEFHCHSCLVFVSGKKQHVCKRGSFNRGWNIPSLDMGFNYRIALDDGSNTKRNELHILGMEAIGIIHPSTIKKARQKCIESQRRKIIKEHNANKRTQRGECRFAAFKKRHPSAAISCKCCRTIDEEELHKKLSKIKPLVYKLGKNSKHKN